MTQVSLRAARTEDAAEIAEIWQLGCEAGRQVKANGHAKAWLAVVEGNARARAFYERSGWVDEGAFDYAARTENGTVAVPCRRYTRLL